ncbi:MAG: sigma-70 family RNA polymerase sigma factor [Eubacterium sp.]|nr:sigma-70 family RNA polymerase sigma factor [Eubacterium sp.]
MKGEWPGKNQERRFRAEGAGQQEGNPAGPPDEALVLRYQEGDAAAADILLERYKQLVRARARTLYLAGGDQEDLLQEGMLGLFKAIRRYDAAREDHMSFRNYAALCLDRQMYSAIHSSQRKKHQPLNTSVSLDALEPGVIDGKLGTTDSPEVLLLGEESFRQMLEEIRRALSPYEAQVLELYLDGLNYLEIAQKLGKSPKSVDNALNRIKNKGSAFYLKH